jgi:hypothetical protein
MIEFEFLILVCPKQVQFLVSICVCDKFQLSSTSVVIGFQENIQQFIPKVERNLSVEGMVAPFTINFNDDAQHNVKHKFHFDELK